ncbi:uncharacterized protein I303_100925 [Kwoniella dejecticola CBS 10117]|uniref:Cytochrome c oxidase assembly protein COX20, mitochondrial n=1 Tax=Kwoniella dejecticola CBS 10117 TaxID=1296121 RepID=A0A1A6AGB2_9TREE|nr:uncharacterized protein I303_00929 [Kwoniella dejecticola CBS 10117]OBR89107.1 hypothetical protein I303_00929 [Kwoniella dejecticola CBS 10117]
MPWFGSSAASSTSSTSRPSSAPSSSSFSSPSSPSPSSLSAPSSSSESSSQSSITTSRTVNAPLNIPAGNSPITPDAQPMTADENLSGDTAVDLKKAMKRIRPAEDFQNIGKIPCARNSLLYGIAGGTGLGAVRFLGSRKPKSAANWAVGSFILISGFQWEMCNRARRKELAQMRAITERYPHRHISKLKQQGQDWVPPPSSTTPTPTSAASGSNPA